MKPPMTQRQKDAFEFIERYIAARGIAPASHEIAEAIGLRSKSGVNRIVNGLVERGALLRFPNRARGIAIADLTAGRARPMEEAPPDKLILIFTLQNGWHVDVYDPVYWQCEKHGPFGWVPLPPDLTKKV